MARYEIEKGCKSVVFYYYSFTILVTQIRTECLNRCGVMATSKQCNVYTAQVEIKDETSLKVTTNRGEKEFEFDSVFSHTSTQVSLH